MVNPTQGLHALNSTLNEALKRGFQLETWVKCCRFLSTLPADLLGTENVADKQSPNPGRATMTVRLTPHLSSIRWVSKKYEKNLFKNEFLCFGIRCFGLIFLLSDHFAQHAALCDTVSFFTSHLNNAIAPCS